MSALDVLVGARRQLTEKGWTRGEFAKDKNGSTVATGSDAAVCYCLDGAMRSLKGDPYSYLDARKMIRRVIGASMLISDYNDNVARSVDDVLSVLDQAIELCKEQVPA
jgi:hypothetical protein